MVKTMKYMLHPFVADSKDSTAFEIVRGQTLSYKDQTVKNALAALTIERDLDLVRTSWKLHNNIANVVALIGGFALSVWLIFFMLADCCTRRKFENYMASELYTVAEEDSKKMLSKRGLLSYGFFNEINPADGKTLNTNRVNICNRIFFCCKTKGGKIFAMARELNAQELNIASIIKSQRESKAAVTLLKSSMGDQAHSVVTTHV